MSVCRFI